jgi:hypothetical protein
LKHYNQRRTQFVIKLALISAVSRGELGTISPIDLERAWAWLFEVEEFMPDVFRAMKGRTDQFIIEELHMRVTALWKMNGGKAVPRQTLRVFVNQFANHDKIEKLIDMAVAQNVLDRVAGTEMFLPRPKHLHGVE